MILNRLEFKLIQDLGRYHSNGPVAIAVEIHSIQSKVAGSKTAWKKSTIGDMRILRNHLAGAQNFDNQRHMMEASHSRALLYTEKMDQHNTMGTEVNCDFDYVAGLLS